MANDYKRLAAIVASTQDRKRPLELLIRMGADLGAGTEEVRRNLWLVVMMGGTRQLAAAPFDPDHPDEAARDVARQLTLDRSMPHGMDE